MKFKVGVIGIGEVAEGHLRGYKEIEDAQIVALCTRRKERLKWASDEFGVSKTYTDYKEMIDREDLDIVSILAPEQVHREMCCYAAERKIHILVEKPVAMSYRETEDIARVIKKNNVKLIVCQNYRWFPECIQAKRDIDNGLIGDIYYLEFRELCRFKQEYRPWLDEVDQINEPFMGYPPTKFRWQWLDKSVHSIDLMRYFTGLEISRIYTLIGGHGNLPLPGENTSFAAVVLGERVIGQVLHLWGSHIWGPRAFGFSMGCRIEGEEGTIIIARGHEKDPYQTKNQYSIYKNEKLVYSTTFPIYPQDWHLSFGNVLKELIDAIKEDREPSCNIWDNLKTIRPLEAGYESVKMEKVVKLRCPT